MTATTQFRTVLCGTAALAAVLLLAACGASRSDIPQGIVEPDKFLYESGTESLEKKRWLTAREYFRRIIDGYPQSTLRPDAKLGIADSYQGEGTTEGYILAVNEYREFLTFYPTSPRADYAQYQLGMTHQKQMRKPQRDQTETREAIREFEALLERYPNSTLRREAEERLREAKDRLGTAEYEVGLFYYKQEWYPGAIKRFKDLLARDPEYTYRDAVYYHLAESLVKVKLQAEALPYFDRLVKEFTASEYLEEAQQRIVELKAAMDLSKPVPADGEPATAPAPATSTATAAPPS